MASPLYYGSGLKGLSGTEYALQLKAPHLFSLLIPPHQASGQHKQEEIPEGLNLRGLGSFVHWFCEAVPAVVLTEPI